MALLEGVIAFDKSVASFPWTSREAVTDLFRAQLSGQSADAQLNGSSAVEAQLSRQPADGVVSSGATETTESLERSGSERDKSNGTTIDSPKDMNGGQVKDGIGKVGSNGGMAGDSEAVVEYWSAQMAGLLEDLRSVRIGGAAEKTGGAKDTAAGHGAKDMRWKPCEQATEYRTLHRPGPNGTSIHCLTPASDPWIYSPHPHPPPFSRASKQQSTARCTARAQRHVNPLFDPCFRSVDLFSSPPPTTLQPCEQATEYRTLHRRGPTARQSTPCEQATEYRTLHRPGPNGTAVHTTCIEGVVHAPADAALAMSCDAPFFKEWWPNINMPSHRCEESRYIKRVGENFHLSFMRRPFPLFSLLNVPRLLLDLARLGLSPFPPYPIPFHPFPLLAFSAISHPFTPLQVQGAMLPENPATADFTNHGCLRPRHCGFHQPRVQPGGRPCAPAWTHAHGISGGYAVKDMGRGRAHMRTTLPGHMRMGISGGYAVKDMGEGRAHMRCIFTLDLKFPPALVNFIIQQCGGILYQWFTEELARIYDDPSSTKGKAFRQALHDEPLYNHVRPGGKDMGVGEVKASDNMEGLQMDGGSQKGGLETGVGAAGGDGGAGGGAGGAGENVETEAGGL
ncbi:unnamed protein product [Closterium sp. NIES-64]|nr:unnamed protein product [Closterium sp. NIES-64]